MKMKLLNAFSLNMIERDCSINITKLSLDGAKNALVRGVDNDRSGDRYKFLGTALDAESCIGHEDTANVLGNLLGVRVPANRRTITLEPGDCAIVAQYKGPRLAEGTKTLPEGAKIEFFRVEIEKKIDPEKIYEQGLEQGRKIGQTEGVDSMSDEDMMNAFE